MSIVEPRHSECRDCKFFNPNRPHSGRCGACDAGDFFEERFDDRAPNDNELMMIFAEMNGFSDDD